MAVSSTIRCQNGISKFLLPSENCEELVSAFQYTDSTVEVHSLKKDCTPLYLEQNTAVDLLAHESFGSLLVSTTPCASNSLKFRVWDVVHGLVPKQLDLNSEFVHTELLGSRIVNQEVAFDVFTALKEDYECHITASLDNYFCMILNGKLCVLMEAYRSDNGVISFDTKTVFPLKNNTTATGDSSPVTDVLFLKEKQKIYLLIADGINVSVMLADNDQLTNSSVLTIPTKKTKATSISNFLRITCSKCLIIDNTGHISLFSLPNTVISLKLPSSIGGHQICTVVGFRHTSEGILAICNSDHTINLYSLADIITSVHNNTVATYVKPYRILCSQFPINSLSFIQRDQLAMASTVNQSVTFWGGLAPNIN